jgi:hypothetical protein
MKRRLKDIRDYMRLRRFNTIFDVLDAELQELKVQQVREVIGIAISTAAEAKEEVFDRRRKW